MLIDNGENNIIVNKNDNIVINIQGNNNNIYIDKISTLDKVSIYVEGNNSIVKIESLRRCNNLRIIVKGGSNLTIGKHTTIEGLYILLDRGKSIHMGEDCMISFGVSMRTTDAHGIYSLETGDLINPDGNIFIEDHVWIAQDVIVSKNSYIGSHSVIGAKSFVQNIKIDKNTLNAGIPIKTIKDNIIFDRRYTENIYNQDKNVDWLFENYIERYQND